MSFFINFINILCLVLTWAILVRVVLSWFNLRPENPLITIVHGITEPILSPLRRIVPRIGMIDITPMIAIVILWMIPLLLYNLS